MRTSAIRVFLGTALALVAAISSGCRAKSSAGEGKQQLPQARIGHASPPRLVCPPVGSVVPSPKSNRGHWVTLRWNASRRADAKHADAVGYCIYRGANPNAPPTELINHLPFPETQCVDDSVENGKQYFYVVRAISVTGALSDFSKPPAPAKIPTRPPASFRTSGVSIPLCRESESTKNP
jgi:hypothetical protein